MDCGESERQRVSVLILRDPRFRNGNKEPSCSESVTKPVASLAGLDFCPTFIPGTHVPGYAVAHLRRKCVCLFRRRTTGSSFVTGSGDWAGLCIAQPRLLLQRLYVADQIRDPLLYLGRMMITNRKQDGAPDWHIFGAMGCHIDVATNDFGDVGCGKLTLVVVLNLSQIRHRILECGSRRSGSFSIDSVTGGTISLVHLFAGRGWSVRRSYLADFRLFGGLLRCLSNRHH